MRTGPPTACALFQSGIKSPDAERVVVFVLHRHGLAHPSNVAAVDFGDGPVYGLPHFGDSAKKAHPPAAAPSEVQAGDEGRGRPGGESGSAERVVTAGKAVDGGVRAHIDDNIFRPWPRRVVGLPTYGIPTVPESTCRVDERIREVVDRSGPSRSG